MESQVNPNLIQERADKFAEATQAADKEVADKTAADAAAKADADKSAEAAAKELADKNAADKSKVVADKKTDAEPKAPNDPQELRKWNTKVSQDNAALRDEVKALKASIDRMMKKPIDYKELAKNPEALQKQIETEREEAVAEVQDQLQEAINRAVTHETTVERMRREQDTANYPDWGRLFPAIQALAANVDPRINFNQLPGKVLDDMYALAGQLNPAAAKAADTTPAKPVKSEAEIEAEIAARVAEAEKKAFEKAQASLKAEASGAGVGSSGKGGRRTNGMSKEALKDMPLADLKKLISQDQ